LTYQFLALKSEMWNTKHTKHVSEVKPAN